MLGDCRVGSTENGVLQHAVIDLREIPALPHVEPDRNLVRACGDSGTSTRHLVPETPTAWEYGASGDRYVFTDRCSDPAKGCVDLLFYVTVDRAQPASETLILRRVNLVLVHYRAASAVRVTTQIGCAAVRLSSPVNDID